MEFPLARIPSHLRGGRRTIGCFVFIVEMVCERRIIIGRYDVSKVKDGRSREWLDHANLENETEGVVKHVVKVNDAFHVN